MSSITPGAGNVRWKPRMRRPSAIARLIALALASDIVEFRRVGTNGVAVEEGKRVLDARAIEMLVIVTCGISEMRRENGSRRLPQRMVFWKRLFGKDVESSLDAPLV